MRLLSTRSADGDGKIPQTVSDNRRDCARVSRENVFLPIAENQHGVRRIDDPASPAEIPRRSRETR